MDKLGKKIKIARRTKRITQTELARAIGVSDKSISAYESGRIDPPISVLSKIAKSTDHSLEYFISESTENSIVQKLAEIERLLTTIKSFLKK